ncbi:MAG TPA: isocitrate lyase/phosphoenolpyruvate mutase family protein, partial [Glycomyces sp.]|nr:isocitrate lyase/phosphoenolpyruvate mutase family protein [Glycomyces sp.]
MAFDRYGTDGSAHSDEDGLTRRAEAFARLHVGGDPFLIPNPWDAGTAKMLHAIGFKALATTSGGLAAALGKIDRNAEVTREETLRNAEHIAEATPLPVSIDLEDCFGETPEAVAETIALAAGTGAVGGSIEDFTGRRDAPIRNIEEAVERVTAAAEAASKINFPFTLTARCENFLYGRGDLQDTIERLNAYAEAGADVLYAPALPDAESIRAVCESVDRPVNVLLGAGHRLTVSELFELGVQRVSLGSSLSRTALGAFK